MPAVRIRPRAEIDLFEIWNYIADDSEARADAFIDKIHQRFVALSEQPSMGRARDELALGVRSHPVGSYIIFYRAMDPGIDIVRVLHGSRDMGTTFSP